MSKNNYGITKQEFTEYIQDLGFGQSGGSLWKDFCFFCKNKEEEQQGGLATSLPSEYYDNKSGGKCNIRDAIPQEYK